MGNFPIVARPLRLYDSYLQYTREFSTFGAWQSKESGNHLVFADLPKALHVPFIYG